QDWIAAAAASRARGPGATDPDPRQTLPCRQRLTCIYVTHGTAITTPTRPIDGLRRPYSFVTVLPPAIGGRRHVAMRYGVRIRRRCLFQDLAPPARGRTARDDRGLMWTPHLNPPLTKRRGCAAV